MRESKRPALIAMAILAVLTGGARAAEPGEGKAPSPPARTVELGLALYAVPRPYEGVGVSPTPVPIGNIAAGRFFFEGSKAGFRWKERELVGWRVFATPRFLGYESGQSEALDGMKARKFSGDVGGSLTLRPIPFIVDVSARRDVIGRSGGWETMVDADFLLPVKGWLLRPSVGVQWQDFKTVDYYYGVRRVEARPAKGRPAYEGRDTASWYLELEAHGMLGRRLRLVAGVADTFLGAGITDSPIVDTSSILSGYLGLLYVF